MDIQGVMPFVADLVNRANLTKDKKCNADFEKLMKYVNEGKEIEEMKQFLSEKFNVTVTVTDYSCEKTDSTAESYDLFMLDEYDFHGGRNVVISKKSLLRMKTDSIFRQKVYKSIEDLSCTSKLTGGTLKSTGVVIHEDGTGGYWTEFDWGDEEDDKKKPAQILRKEPNRIELHRYEKRDNENLEAQIALIGSIFVQDRGRKGEFVKNKGYINI